jgi:glycosyltransferase involved in cell wall biosynthesis
MRIQTLEFAQKEQQQGKWPVVTKVVHIISGLTRAGAQIMLAKLVSAMDRSEFLNVIVSLTDVNAVGQQLRSAGFQVHALNMKRGRLSLGSIARLSRFLKASKPDVVQTWLYHADLTGGVAALLAGHRQIVWNVRTGSFKGGKIQTYWVMKLCSVLSSFLPKRIVFCSNKSRELHLTAGYSRRKAILIPNGIDLGTWTPSLDARTRLRRALGVSENAVVVGHAARFHPQKDHEGFVQAAASAHEQEPSLRFILCGDDVHSQNETLVNAVGATGKPEIFTLLGPRDDMPQLMNAFDFFCLSSFSEAFPNVLLEAMACGIPCVTTDVGDARYIIGDTGVCVPPRNVVKLADAIVKMAQMKPNRRTTLGEQARKRAMKDFDILQISNRYATLYRQLAKNKVEAA